MYDKKRIVTAFFIAFLLTIVGHLSVFAADLPAADTALSAVLSDCMPGEYDTAFGGWVFTNANGEGYIAETVRGLGGKDDNDGCAMILGYAGTETASNFDLYLQADKSQASEKAAQPVTLSYSMFASVGQECRLALEVYTGNGKNEIYSALPNEENNEMEFSCFENKKSEAEMGKWNSYSLFLDPQTGACRFSVNGRVWHIGFLNGEPEEATYISKIRFVMKSENDNDYYALDDVCLIYGAEAPLYEIVFTSDENSVTATAKSADAQNMDFSHAALFVTGSIDGRIEKTAVTRGTENTADTLSCTLNGIDDDVKVEAYLWNMDSFAPMCSAHRFVERK